METLSNKIHPFSDPRVRIVWFKRTVIFTFLLSLSVSYLLWVSSRLYPLSPIIPGFPAFPFPTDYLVLVALYALLLAIGFSQKPRRYIVALLGLIAILFLQDQSRLWPSFYEYSLMLGILVFYPWEKPDIEHAEWGLNTARFMVGAILFWSGMQKLNPAFTISFFEHFAKPITGILPEGAAPTLYLFSNIAPCIEILMGIGLFTKKFRCLALGTAIAMHAFLFFTIGPTISHPNNGAWAWNTGSLLLVSVLFWGEKEVSAKKIILGKNIFFHKVILILVGIMPLFSFFNMWNSAQSFNVYSGNVNSGTIYMSESVRQKLPPEIQSSIQKIFGNLNSLEIFPWAIREFNGGPYPEAGIFKNILKKFCPYGVAPEDIILVVKEKSTWLNRHPAEQRYYCADIAK